MSGIPVWDNHLHLDPSGLGIQAARTFEKAGGTGFTLVHKPYHYPEPENHEASFEITLGLARKVREETSLRLHVALAPHPAELTQMTARGVPLQEAEDIMIKGMEVAARLVGEGRADAFGEVGRPHYPVDALTWESSNRILERSLELARELSIPVILHTEEASPDVFSDLAGLGRKVGFPLEKMVKHFSPPINDRSLNHGLFPSIVASKESLLKALALDGQDRLRFVMETDYMDDPRRPGAVLGHLTVPKRTRWLLSDGHLTEEDCHTIHGDNIKAIYGQ